MGGVRVPFLRPSQLNPSYHLNTERKTSELCLCSIVYVRHSFASLANSLVLLDVFHAILLVPQPLWRIISVHTNVCIEKTAPWLTWRSSWDVLPAELLDEIAGVLRDLLGELNHVNAPQDDVVGLHRIWTWERGAGTQRGHSEGLKPDGGQVPARQVLLSPARQQLVHEDSQGPIVCRHIVAFVEDDLWSHVLRSPAERPRLFAHADLLGKTKIHLKNKRTFSEGFFVFFCRSALTMNMRCLLTTTTEEHSQVTASLM